MAVPLDHNDPGGPSIELTLGRLRAGDPSRRIGALLVNPGGPGASGLELLDRIGAGAEVRARFDIVAWDPRGVGQSTPVTCGGAMSGLRLVDSSPDTPDEQAALDAAATQAAQACGASSGNLLAHVATLDTVDDMDLIRRGLGEEQISYLGFSYGTSLGQLYLDRYPDHLRALAIDGVVDPSVGFESWLESQTRGFDAAMNQVFASCTNSCPNGDAAAAYDELRRQVEVAPLPGSSGLTLGPTELATAAIMTGYSSNLWPSFISGLDRGLSGDGSGLTELAARYWRLVDFDAYTSVVCLDGAHPTNGPDYAAFADRLGAVSPRFGEAIANELSPCASWPAAPRATPGIITGTGSPPVLVVGTTGDPATPYADAVRVAGQLENGVLLTHRGDRHIAYGRSGCATQIVDTYLLSLEVPPEGSTC